MASIWFTLLLKGDVAGALKSVMDLYLAYGMFYLIVGGILFTAVYTRTKSYGISGLVFILYFALVGAAIPVEIQPFVLLLIGFLGSVMIIQLVLNK